MIGCRARRLDTKQLNNALRKRVMKWLSTLGIDKQIACSYILLKAYQEKSTSSSSSSSSSSPRKHINALRELYESSGANSDDLSKGGVDGSVTMTSYWYNGAVLSEVAANLLVAINRDKVKTIPSHNGDKPRLAIVGTSLKASTKAHALHNICLALEALQEVLSFHSRRPISHTLRARRNSILNKWYKYNHCYNIHVIYLLHLLIHALCICLCIGMINIIMTFTSSM